MRKLLESSSFEGQDKGPQEDGLWEVDKQVQDFG
jgi:hypothetical protein